MQRESKCTVHDKTLYLFCKNELKPLCLVCNKSKGHEDHVVRPIEESAQEYKDDLEKLSNKIKNGCKILRQELKNAEKAVLKRIEEMNKKCCNLQKENLAEMPDKVLPFIKLIKDIEDGCKQSAGDFLKDVNKMAEKCISLKQKKQSSTVKTPKGGKTKTKYFPLTERTTPSHPLPFQAGSPHTSSPSSVAEPLSKRPRAGQLYIEATMDPSREQLRTIKSERHSLNQKNSVDLSCVKQKASGQHSKEAVLPSTSAVAGVALPSPAAKLPIRVRKLVSDQHRRTCRTGDAEVGVRQPQQAGLHAGTSNQEEGQNSDHAEEEAPPPSTRKAPAIKARQSLPALQTSLSLVSTPPPKEKAAPPQVLQAPGLSSDEYILDILDLEPVFSDVEGQLPRVEDVVEESSSSEVEEESCVDVGGGIQNFCRTLSRSHPSPDGSQTVTVPHDVFEGLQGRLSALEERLTTRAGTTTRPKEVCNTTIGTAQIKRNITSAHELNAKRAKNDDIASSFPHVNICDGTLESWMKKYKVCVRLDEDTAHSSLILSESYTDVQNSGKDQPRPENVKRFTIHKCVLGREGFIGGKHYWEVDVMKTGSGWCAGIAGESVKRTKRIKKSPEEAIWAVGHWDKDFAFTSPPTPIPLLERCRTLAMYLDYDKGQLAIFDANTSQLLHSFQDRFKERVFPYLNVRQRAKLCLGRL